MNHTKSLLVFIPRLSYGGVSTVTLRLIAGMSYSNFLIHVVVGVGDIELIEKFRKIDNVNLTILNVNKTRLSFNSIRNILSKNNYDILLGVQSHGALMLSLVALFVNYRGSIVSWEHTTPSKSLALNNLKSKFFVYLASLLYKKVNKVFAVSNGVARDIEHFYNIESKKIVVLSSPIYNVVPVKYSGKKSNEFVKFLFIGRLSIEKGIFSILEAFNDLDCENWLFTIVGAGVEEDKLKLYVNNSKRLIGKVKFVGYDQEVARWYLESDTLIMASHYEGLPTVLVEASIYGLPLISTDCESGPNEIIKQYENGLLVPLGDSKALTEAMRYMIRHYDEFHNDESYVVNYKDNISICAFVKALNSVLCQ